MQPAGKVVPEILEHGQKDSIPAASALYGRHGIIVIVLSLNEVPFTRKHQFMRMLIELLPLRSHGNKPVGLYLLVQQVKYKPLMDYGTPEARSMVFPGSEKFQAVMPV